MTKLASLDDLLVQLDILYVESETSKYIGVKKKNQELSRRIISEIEGILDEAEELINGLDNLPDNIDMNVIDNIASLMTICTSDFMDIPTLTKAISQLQALYNHINKPGQINDDLQEDTVSTTA